MPTYKTTEHPVADLHLFHTIGRVVSVVPATLRKSSGPLNLPDDCRVPSSPLMVPMSALLKVNFASTGVWRGSSGTQGPNVPVQSISPLGTGLVSRAWKVAA